MRCLLELPGRAARRLLQRFIQIVLETLIAGANPKSRVARTDISSVKPATHQLAVKCWPRNSPLGPKRSNASSIHTDASNPSSARGDGDHAAFDQKLAEDRDSAARPRPREW